MLTGANGERSSCWFSLGGMIPSPAVKVGPSPRLGVLLSGSEPNVCVASPNLRRPVAWQRFQELELRESVWLQVRC